VRALIGSRQRAFQRAIDEPCTLPLGPPEDGTKRDFAVFASKIQLLSKEVCYKVSLCEFEPKRCSYIIPLSNGVAQLSLTNPRDTLHHSEQQNFKTVT